MSILTEADRRREIGPGLVSLQGPSLGRSGHRMLAFCESSSTRIGSRADGGRVFHLGPSRPGHEQHGPGRFLPSSVRVWRHPEGIAVIGLYGFLSSCEGYADEMDSLFGGGTVMPQWSRAFAALVNDREVSGILIDVHSPGGHAFGCAEAADLVRRSTSVKPIMAYTGGQACSAGYYIASAAEWFVAHPRSQVGSIGAILVGYDDAGMLAQLGLARHVLVSRDSPDKAPSIATEEGRALIQKDVDDFGSMFVADVAKFRNRPVAEVRENFGRGGALYGRDALRTGMVDAVGDAESAIKALAKLIKAAESGPRAPRGVRAVKGPAASPRSDS